jgi:tetratricopeptide (TPR) repeat protein
MRVANRLGRADSRQNETSEWTLKVMNIPTDFRNAMLEAKQMLDKGNLLDAERILRHLAQSDAHRQFPLEVLADIYVQQRRIDECLSVLRELTGMIPDNLDYCAKLASLLDSLGNTTGAIDAYETLIEHQAEEPAAYFNVALLYKKHLRYADALRAYEDALRIGIDRPEEVYSNMGNVYAEMLDAEKAREMYERAVEIAPDNLTALFNLAGLLEEAGQKQQAIELYERIHSIDSTHWDSMARLAILGTVTAEDQSLVNRLKDCINALQEDKLAQEVLHFALGKIYDDLDIYPDAAAAYTKANEFSKGRVLPYVPEQTERAFDRVIEIYDTEWIETRATDSEVSPIFICGMYRSGSTLLERMLAAHPAVAAGGEMQTLAWLTARYLGAFPEGAANATREQLRFVADEYDRKARELAPDSLFVTDKRLDNFLRLGLARAAFPSAKFIQTRRDLRDNSLSIFFHQFGHSASYATDLRHIAHYYQQVERLFAHWRDCFPENILTVDYEELIEAPETVLRGVLDFLGLEWDASVLDFQNSGGLVRTHSIWQVRERLHSRSKGRWQNYEQLLSGFVNPRSDDSTQA